jgi:Tub family
MSWCLHQFTTSSCSCSINNVTDHTQYNHEEETKQPMLDAVVVTLPMYSEPYCLKLYAELSNLSPKESMFAIETIVRRTGDFFTMDLQLPKNNVPLFIAGLHGQTYILKSAPQRDADGDPIMGTVCKRPVSRRDKNKIMYALTFHQTSHKPQKVAYMGYQHPSLFQLLKDSKARPRRCTVQVLGRGTVKSKEPYCEGGYPTLDFYGRGREPSIKNMQLEDPHGKVILQMVKWDRDVFHVDFSYPFDAFHAFGFVLAQFDV